MNADCVSGSWLVHRIVEYVRQFPVFPFDVVDVRDDLDRVLFHYGIYADLSADERVLLTGELVRLAEAFESREARRVMSREEVGQWLCLVKDD